MWWPFQWLVIYVLGGLTFLPLVAASLLFFAWKYGTIPVGDDDPSKVRKAVLQHEDERSGIDLSEKNDGEKIINGKSLDKVEKRVIPPKPLSGWLTVRRQFSPATTPISNPPPELNVEVEAEEGDKPSTYSARIAQTYRSVMDARAARKDGVPKEYYFCVLKGSVLFIYDDHEQSDVVAAVGVDKYTVGIESKDGKFKGKDAEMFAKRNAIVLRLREKEGLPVLGKGIDESEPWYLFSKSNTRMEDFYVALVQNSALQVKSSQTFAETDMQCLVDTLDAEPDPIPMRWFNAMLGRMFFGVYKTAAMEQLIIDRIMKKLSKVPRPSFLSPIVVREVNVGTSAPYFSKPMLKDLTAAGTASFEVNMHYRARANQPDSDVRITIATTATIPTGFKPYVVDLVLAVVLKSIEGNVVVQIKKPPSNRIWWGFTHMPKMEVEIVPIVSERKIQIGMVLKAIEKQLRDVIAESVVSPNMDDIAFFDTSGHDVRGGIFDEASKVKTTKVEIEIAEDPASATAEVPSKKAKQAVVDGDGDEVDLSPGLPRSETAPAVVSSPKKNGKNGKKWFGNGVTPTSSLTSVINRSNDSLTLKPTPTGGEIESLAPSSSASLPESAPEGTASTSSLSSTTTQTLETSSVTSKHEARSMSMSDAHPSSTSTSAGSAGPPPTAASLISTIRSRDKKAIQTQVNSARDAMKKWGVNFAAKRRAGLPETSLESRDEDKPAALYRPPEEDGVRRSSDAGGRTLQERLAAASAAAALTTSNGVSPINVPGRQRSTSSTSSLNSGGRPTLLSSPSKSSINAGTSISPPKFTVSASRPTTEVAKPSMTTGTSGSHARRESSSTPVQMQPSAGKSMVVPRVPKRPGAVTGLGSSPGEGMISRISGEDIRKVGNVNGGVPGVTPETIGDINKELSPPEPTDLIRSNSAPETTSSESASISVSPPEPVLSDSSKSSSKEILEIPDSEISQKSSSPSPLPSPSVFEDVGEKPETPVSPSLGGGTSAEDALRKLVKRDEEALKALEKSDEAEAAAEVNEL